ncbi:hypothetical protein BKA66DRAFT_174193 [Pyrenochaeta sp. MPI-SDFR-AT-0127]|nr:hypothetical protein BKA66DRAFT_174193 [Pyrenochaeta sp. MPI-SDFR-AT-0127]
MDDVKDHLDLRYHRGLDPDVYYRCPTTESLDGALRNEQEKSASSLIPTQIVTEFIFAATSTITIPVSQQPNLEVLIQPADFVQSVTVGHALCHNINGKDRLKIQRSIARSIINVIQKADGYKYSERRAHNKDGGDGARLMYVCLDSFQNRDRKCNKNRGSSVNSEDDQNKEKKRGHGSRPTYDCGGAIHVKFSLKRDAINVVYKHNPIHSRPVDGDSMGAQVAENIGASKAPTSVTTKETTKRKRKCSNQNNADMENVSRDPNSDMVSLPDAPKPPRKKKPKQSAVSGPSEITPKSYTLKRKNSKEPLLPSKTKKRATVAASSSLLNLVAGPVCIRCRENGIQCNKAKPTCNQCQQGLWSCQYEVPSLQKRSKHGCLNCKRRKRKCTEEKPSCAICQRLDNVCKYADSQEA